MKKKLILMCVAGLLAMTAIIGGTLAGFNTSTESKGVTNITVKALGIDILGTGVEGANYDKITLDKGTPGGEMPLRQSVQNNVEEGYTLYTRVTIDKKWDNPELDASMIRLYAGNGESKQELTQGITVNDWIVWYSDAEQIIMYYTKPLATTEVSNDFINSVSFEADMDNSYADANALITFSADAVQEIAAADSIPSEWGVYPVFGENGIINGIEE